MEFKESIKDSYERKGRLEFPMPNQRHTRCSVCKTKYSDYLTHIFGDSHRKNIKKSKFNNDIIKLT